MYLLFETSAGFAIFKVLDKKLLKDVSAAETAFSTPELAKKSVKLKVFQPFENTKEAMKSATAIVESKLSSSLKKLLKTVFAKKKRQLAVCDKVLGGAIKEKLGIECIYSPLVVELMRGIRNQLNVLLQEVTSEKDFTNMSIGLSHSLSRYKLKFSPDKVDTMIVQAIALIDELDKELNVYAMRVKEWYGWHFPELVKIIPDNILYAKTVLKLKNRNNALEMDLSDVLPEDLAEQVKEAAKISMGTEISDEDVLQISMLCEEVVNIHEYRTKLYEYLKNRMNAIAPNLTHMVGELVGARLIAHAGSLLNLAKHPASTVQILGAEKALFRALKSKHNTPKYGLIYHASLVGQAPSKHRGKIARVLANKCAMSARVDALGEEEKVTVATRFLEQVEDRLKNLEDKGVRGFNKGGNQKSFGKPTKFNKSQGYDESGDVNPKKRKRDEKEAPKNKKKKF